MGYNVVVLFSPIVIIRLTYRYLVSGVCVFVQDLYGVRSDLGNLLKALGRLEEAKVPHFIIFFTVVMTITNRHVTLKQLNLVMILQLRGQTLAVSTMHRGRSGWPYIILKRFTLLASH